MLKRLCDTVDHLIDSLVKWVGVLDGVLVIVSLILSILCDIDNGVPQGIILDPFLFSFYFCLFTSCYLFFIMCIHFGKWLTRTQIHYRTKRDPTWLHHHSAVYRCQMSPMLSVHQCIEVRKTSRLNEEEEPGRKR